MATQSIPYRRALELAKKAVDEDMQENFVQAYAHYQSSVDSLLLYLESKRDDPEISEGSAQGRYADLPLKTIIKRYLDRMIIFRKPHTGKSRAIATMLDNEIKDGDDQSAEMDPEGRDDDYDRKIQELRDGFAGITLPQMTSGSWNDVVGVDAAKLSLKEIVVLPIKFPSLYARRRQPSHWKGILLYGPPGVGISHLVTVLAAEGSCELFYVNGTDLLDKTQEDALRCVQNLFQLAKVSKPAIIFFDRLDALTRVADDADEATKEKTRSVVAEFLYNMAGTGPNFDGTGLFVIGATNLPWIVNSSVKRRFDKRIYLPLPGLAQRKKIFELEIGEIACELTAEDFSELATRTEGYSGADIAIISKYAIAESFREITSSRYFKRVEGDQFVQWSPCTSDDPAAEEKVWRDIIASVTPPVLGMSHFTRALECIYPSASDSDIKEFEDWTNRFGSYGG